MPAWLASPIRSSRHRPCGQIAAPTPTGRSRSTRPRPCSTCSSTNVPTRRSVSGSAPRWAGSCPASAIASAIVTPSVSRSARARSGSSWPVSRRDPAQAMPNRAPSSSAKLATPIGRAGRNPSRISTSSAARDDTTPSGPSKAPPSGTESRCEPSDQPRPAGRHGGVRVAPPRPLVAGAVLHQVQAPCRRLAGEPLPQRHVVAGPGEPAVAAGARVPADALERRPHRVKAHVPNLGWSSWMQNRTAPWTPWPPPASRTPSPGTARSAAWPRPPPRAGSQPRDIIKTLVVRRADDDFLFVLVPGRPRDLLAQAARPARREPHLDARRSDGQGGHGVRAGHDHAVRLHLPLAGRRRRDRPRPHDLPRRRRARARRHARRQRRRPGPRRAGRGRHRRAWAERPITPRAWGSGRHARRRPRPRGRSRRRRAG